MSTINSSPGTPAGLPPLEAFRESAQTAPQVRVSVDGDSFVVLGQGQMSGEGGTRSVAWVQGDIDTTSLFVEALKYTYGSGLSGAVSRELGLDPSPGKPLASRLVTQALDMSQTGQQALAGVDFLTALDHSAVAGGPGYRMALAQEGVDAARITPTQREAIDKAVRAHFEAAAANGQSPVPAQTVADWLRAEIHQLTKPPA